MDSLTFFVISYIYANASTWESSNYLQIFHLFELSLSISSAMKIYFD